MKLLFLSVDSKPPVPLQHLNLDRGIAHVSINGISHPWWQIGGSLDGHNSAA